jgi:hypothetical protein
MVKHKTSPAFSLTLTLPLGQLPHVNSTSAIIKAKREPSCLICSAARDAHSSPGDLIPPGHRTQPLPLKPVRCPAFEGSRVNFVSDAAGSVARDVTDPEPGGALPVLFRRVQGGARREEDAGLGAGWSLRLRRMPSHRRRLGHALAGRGRAPRAATVDAGGRKRFVPP